jgi:methionyl-tRNA formyltransferase
MGRKSFNKYRMMLSADQLISSMVGCTQPPAPFATLADEPNPKSSHLLVTASFGRILRKRQLDSFLPGRRLNVHPSLLPHYRGPAPVQHALLNGERETGVCVIEMLKIKDGAVDSGDIWGCEKAVRPNFDLSKK